MTATNYCQWTQEGNTLFLSTKKGKWHFIMPDDWKMSETHPDLLRLAEIVTLYPFLTKEIDNSSWVPSRKAGNHPGLSYSTGIDSTAAMLLMPDDTQPVYYRRDYESNLNHANADRCIHAIADFRLKKVTVMGDVSSDSELIRKAYEKLGHGFSTDYHCGVGLILLADYLDIGAFGTGMVLESAYLYSGFKYRNFADTIYWQKWSRIFEACGLPIYQPVAGCSEIVTQKIVKDSGLSKYAVSCLRGEEGRICGECYKCYRKMLRSQSETPISDEVENILSHTPLKMASSLIYEMQIAQARGKKAPEQVKPYMEKDVSWLDRYYPPSIDLIPEKYRELTKNNLEKHVKPMEMPYKMHEWDVENGA